MSGLSWNRSAKTAAAVLLMLCVGLLFLGYRYQTKLWDLPRLLGKKLATPVLERIYADDATKARAISASYFHGAERLQEDAPLESWRRMGQRGRLELLEGSRNEPLERRAPFVFESPGAGYLGEMMQRYRLRQLVARGGSEYDSMLALFGWIGTRWDHGADPVPDGGLPFCRPAEVIAAGEQGARFWCEVCARVTVQAATALGWPARLITASSDGYRWEHALAEVWSNQFNKWFLVDTDYNIVYEARGIPLSAYELCHDGPGLRVSGLLKARRLAPLKPSLRDVDLLHLYRYVQVDLRNDWYTRRLRPGSPAGGDLATWWTARSDLGPILTSKTRVEARALFDWPVNAAEIHATGLWEQAAGSYLMAVGLRGYSPYFSRFLVKVDRGAWRDCPEARGTFKLARGRHLIEARIETQNGDVGPVARVEFLLH